MEEIRITRVAMDDIGELRKISIKTFFDTFAAYNSEENMQHYLKERLSLRRLTAELSDEGSEFYFACLNDEVIGYLKINTAGAQTEIRDDHALEIERIYVLQAYHGKQVGQVLYEWAIRIARERQLDYIWLGV